MQVKDKHEQTINFSPRLFIFLMPHYAKCDVISGQNKKLKLKYLVNKALERKSIKELFIYQSSKFSFSCVSSVESVSREIDEIRLSPSHQRARETMHYSPVNNKKITCVITGTRDLWTAENRECFCE